MSAKNIKCQWLADQYDGLTDGVGWSLETMFEVVIRGADEWSLQTHEPPISDYSFALARQSPVRCLGRPLRFYRRASASPEMVRAEAQQRNTTNNKHNRRKD